MSDELRADMLMLASNFSKIVEINWSDNNYFVVKMNESERDEYDNVDKWVEAFVEQGVHPDDQDKFLSFFWRSGHQGDRRHIVFYRRLINNDWHMVCMESRPMRNYTEDDRIVLVTVREVDDYLDVYRKQNGRLL